MINQISLHVNQTKDWYRHNTTSVGSQRSLVIHVEVFVTLLVLYGILCVISLFGNFLVCYVILKNKRLHTATNFFIANLAVSDLLVTFINVPFNIARNLMQDWPFGEIPCHLVNFSLALTTYVSTYTLTSIALDRHRVVLKPLSRRMSRRFALIILILIWVVALCLSLPYGLYMQVMKMRFLITREYRRCRFVGPPKWAGFQEFLTVTTFLLQYVVPFALIAVAYGRIVQSLWARTQVGAVTATQQLSRARAKRKSIKLLIAVVVVFALCWLPLNMYHLLSDFYPRPDKFGYGSVAFFACHWVAISSTCYNPFVYCWLNENFREEVKSRFNWFFVPCRRRRNTRRSTDAEVTLLDGEGRTHRAQSSRLDEMTSGGGGGGGGGAGIPTSRSDSGRFSYARRDHTLTSLDTATRDTPNSGAENQTEIDLLPNFHITANGESHALSNRRRVSRQNPPPTPANNSARSHWAAKKKAPKLSCRVKSFSEDDNETSLDTPIDEKVETTVHVQANGKNTRQSGDSAPLSTPEDDRDTTLQDDSDKTGANIKGEQKQNGCLKVEIRPTIRQTEQGNLKEETKSSQPIVKTGVAKKKTKRNAVSKENNNMSTLKRLIFKRDQKGEGAVIYRNIMKNTLPPVSAVD